MAYFIWNYISSAFYLSIIVALILFFLFFIINYLEKKQLRNEKDKDAIISILKKNKRHNYIFLSSLLIVVSFSFLLLLNHNLLKMRMNNSIQEITTQSISSLLYDINDAPNNKINITSNDNNDVLYITITDDNNKKQYNKEYILFMKNSLLFQKDNLNDIKKEFSTYFFK